jgi:hypothetical protein
MKTKPKTTPKSTSPSALITQRIAELGDWRGETLAAMRALIKEVDPDVVEEWKWRGTPVWSHAGGICTGETYKAVVKLTFYKGAALPDPSKLFNSSLDGNTRRAIDIGEGEAVDAKAFKALVRAAIALNTGGKATKKAAPRATRAPARAARPKRARAATAARPARGPSGTRRTRSKARTRS